MANYRKILVAYDGSASAKSALAVAAGIAGKDKSWIKVLAVVPEYQGDLELIGVSNIKETIEGPGQKLLVEAKQVAEGHGIHVFTNLEQGEPYERIVRVAVEENCDLIVMGRSGLTHLERALMGGVTARVIGHTDRNVLIVPEGAELAWSRILIATDGSKNSEAAIRHGVTLAREQKAQLDAVSVVHTDEEMIALAPEHIQYLADQAQKHVQEVADLAGKEGVTVATHVREGEPHEQITSLAAEIGASLVVMGTHGRKGFSRLLMGSVTERTIGYAPCPVLIIH
jgi:nucleotide-binding universal stress UspA family protein